MAAIIAAISSAHAAPASEVGLPAEPNPAPGTPSVETDRRGPGEDLPIHPSPVIVGSSTCPQPEAVWQELGTLVPSERLARRLAETTGATPPVQIFDLGVPYRVIAAGRVREYRDESRDCAHRARVAAVFVALALDPAVAVIPEAAIATVPPVIAVVPPVVPASHLVSIDVGGVADVGWGRDGHITQAGVGLRLAIGRGPWAVVLGAVGLFPTDTVLGGVPLRHGRLPVDVGLRRRFLGDAIVLYGEAGMTAAVLSEHARDLLVSESNTAVELGAFAAVGARFARASRLGPFVTLKTEIVPGPPSIQALPQGTVGHTPFIWLGATAGASIDF
jgi:hypothetical protein